MALLRVALFGAALQLGTASLLRSSRGAGREGAQKIQHEAQVRMAPHPTKLADGALKPGETCFDSVADWKDAQGDSCQSYHDNQYCDRENGVFFGTKTAMMLYNAGPDSPTKVCCYCGGGIIKDCDATCQLLKKHEVLEIESRFHEMSEAAGDAVTEAGSSTMAKMVKDMNATMEDALARLHAHSSKMLKENLVAEERAFDRVAGSAVLSPQEATKETAEIASKAAKEQMFKALQHLDGTELRAVAEKAEQKFQDAEAAWELAAAKAQNAFEHSEKVSSELTGKMEQRMGSLDASVEPLRSTDVAASAAESESRRAEEESKLAEDMVYQLRNETRGASELLSETSVSGANATDQSEGATKAALEANDKQLAELEMLVSHAEDLAAK